MPEEKNHLIVREESDVVIVEFADRKILDELCISEIGEELAGVIESRPQIRLLLNFNNVEHLSSAALGMLITLREKVTKASGSLKLAGIIPQIYEVFKITRLNHVFDIHESENGALAAFS